MSKSDYRFFRVFSLGNHKKSSKEPSLDLAASSGCVVDPCRVWHLIKTGLCGRLVAKKLVLQKGNRMKRLMHA